LLIKPTVLSLSARGLFLENGRHEPRDVAAIRVEGDIAGRPKTLAGEERETPPSEGEPSPPY
jgi:hypothetical protein